MIPNTGKTQEGAHKKVLEEQREDVRAMTEEKDKIYITSGTFSACEVVCISQHRSSKLNQLVQLGLKMTKSAKNDRLKPTYQLTTIIIITFNLLKAK